METKQKAISYFNDGNKLYKGRLYNDALQQYQLAVENDLTSYNAHFCVAKTLVRLHKKEEAIEYLKKYFYLIPEEKQSDYLMAFSNILSEEDHEKEALDLIDFFDVDLKPEHTTTFLSLLLKNGKIKEVYLKLLSFNSEQSSAIYNQLMQTQHISAEIRKQFSQQNLISQFQTLENQISILDQSHAPNDAYAQELSANRKKLKDYKSLLPDDVKQQLDNMQQDLDRLKMVLLDDAEKQLQNDNKDVTKIRLEQLKKIDFNDERIDKLQGDLTRISNAKLSKTIKTVFIIGGIVALLLMAFFGYKYYNDKKIEEQHRIEQLENEIKQLDEQIELGSFTEVGKYAYVHTQQANMRQGPSDDYPVLMRLNNGTDVYVIAQNAKTGWYKVRIDSGTEGYMSYKVLTLYR